MERFLCALKYFITAVLAAVLILVILWGIQSMHETISVSSSYIETAAEIDPAEKFKTVRQQLRALQKAQLNEVAHSADADAELASMAQRQLLLLCEREEDEMTLEGILEMRGWHNPIVTVHEDSVNVLLQAEVITRQESSVIMELVCRETGVQSGNVKIIPIN